MAEFGRRCLGGYWNRQQVLYAKNAINHATIREVSYRLNLCPYTHLMHIEY